jgi:poly(hydroxyalkanoate) depolymerase family esterase
MKILQKQLWLLTVVLLVPWVAPAGELVDQLYKKKTYAGSRDRQYSIFLPEGYSAGEALPLVVVLHGCNQTHRNIMNDTRFNDLAEAEKFIVVYPFVTSYDGLRNTNCWGYWLEDEIHEGSGEAADIAGIISEVQNAYSIDPDRIHITGLSSGGAMTTAVMVAYSEIIASGAPAAGIAYGETECAVRGVCLNYNVFDPATWFYWWTPKFESTEETAREMDTEMGADKRLVPLLLLHATSDLTVDITAARNNAAAWAALFGVDMSKPVASEDGETEGVAWHYNRYGSYGTSSAIETHFADGPGHAWLGDAQGTYADPDGPDWAAIAWSFFKAHPMPEH